MDQPFAQRLPARSLYRVPRAGAVRIRCLAGSLWLTLDDDLRDIILQPGDCFTAGEARRGLLYALEPATFTVVPAGQTEAAAPCPSMPWQPAAD